MILDEGDDFIVLWRHDDDASGKPNLAEMQRIEWFDTNDSIRAFGVPSSYTDAALDAINTEYELTADFGAETAGLRGEAYFPASVWATSVNSWSLSLNDGDPQVATLVSYRVNLQQGDLADSVVGAASLKNRGFTATSGVPSGGDAGGDDGGDAGGDDGGDAGGDDGGGGGDAGGGGDDGGDDDDDGPTFICTELYRQGLMSDEIFALDAIYGERLRANDPAVFRGYAAWAPSWVQVMRRNDVGGWAATKITAAAALPWARAMASRVDGSRETDPVGEWIIHLCYPVMRALGDAVGQGDYEHLLGEAAQDAPLGNASPIDMADAADQPTAAD